MLTVYIRADGSVEPPSANVSTPDRVVYFLTGDVKDEVVVERSNMVLDGRGFAVQGKTIGTGISLRNVGDVKIVNVVVKDFDYGVSMIGS